MRAKFVALPELGRICEKGQANFERTPRRIQKVYQRWYSSGRSERFDKFKY